MKASYRAVFLMCLVFASGVLIGGAAVFLFKGAQAPEPWPTASTSRPERDDKEGSFFRDISRILDFDEDQEQKVRAVLDESRKKYRSTLRSSRKELGRIRTETRQKIRELLRPDQVEKFDQFIAEHRKRHSRKKNNSSAQDK